jgi:hypothetical protein
LNDKQTVAKRVVKSFDFSQEHHHVALVDRAANQTNVLLMKAADSVIDVGVTTDKEVRIELSMHEFLRKFFDMWHEDANLLAGMLGFEQKTWMDREDPDYISVEVLKNATETGVVDESLLPRIENIYKKHGEVLMKKQEEGKTETVDVTKAVEAAVSKALEIQKAALDTANGKIEEMLKNAEKAELDKFTELVKGYSFVPVESQEELVKAIHGSRKVEGFASILTTLEKAQEAIEAAVTPATGSDESAEVDLEKSAKTDTASVVGATVMEIIKSRKTQA